MAGLHLEAVQGLNRGLRFALRHIDETEAAGLAGFPVIDELDRIYLAVTFEEASTSCSVALKGRLPT